MAWAAKMQTYEDDTDVDDEELAMGCSDGSVEVLFADSGMVVGCDYAWDDPAGMAGAAGAHLMHDQRRNAPIYG